MKIFFFFRRNQGAANLRVGTKMHHHCSANSSVQLWQVFFAGGVPENEPEKQETN